MNQLADLPSVATPSTPARRVDALIAHYSSSHQNPTNEAIHFVAIPLIMLSLCGLIHALHPAALGVFLVASLVYYARLSWVMFGCMLAWSGLLYLGVLAMGNRVLPISIGMFVGAWIIQFIGHKIEGKKPSFFEDLQYLWVGPMFLLSKVFAKLKLRW
jgi:uncharacterized membrane protein YGL010W